jgi:hypothetical protein
MPLPLPPWDCSIFLPHPMLEDFHQDLLHPLSSSCPLLVLIIPAIHENFLEVLCHPLLLCSFDPLRALMLPYAFDGTPHTALPNLPHSKHCLYFAVKPCKADLRAPCALVRLIYKPHQAWFIRADVNRALKRGPEAGLYVYRSAASSLVILALLLLL